MRESGMNLKGYAYNYEGYCSRLTSELENGQISEDMVRQLGYKIHDGIVYTGMRAFG